jgi:ornithine carbamoyltransferase
MQAKDFLSIDQLRSEDLHELLDRARLLKAKPFSSATLLANRVVALIFEKPSLRTRVSFEVATQQLGGHCLYLSPAEVGLGEREAVADVARVLSRYVDALVARTFLHSDVEALADAATVPVINGLSDRSHPCQILADLLTIQERFGHLHGLRLVYVGDGNNVARSLIEAAPLARYSLCVACPHGYEPDVEAVAAARALGGAVEVVHDAPSSVRGADVIYTDAWFSMGQEAEREARAAVFPPFRVSRDLMAQAPEHAIVLHCLPAHRGEEITDEVIEGPQSAVFDQAENRLHAQKALFAALLGPG